MNITDDDFNRIIELEVLPNIAKALHSIVAQGYDTTPFVKDDKSDIKFCKAKANELKVVLDKYIDAETEIITKIRGSKSDYFYEANMNIEEMKDYFIYNTFDKASNLE